MNIKDLSKRSVYNRNFLEKSKECACYYCCNTFKFDEIQNWIDNNQTAMCPKCNIDSVIGDYNVDFDEEFLNKASNYWF